jgi:SecD/SecF fusion protein
VASRRSHLTLVGLLVAALVGVALLAIPSSPAHKELRKGLDLQGGLEVVLEAQPPRGHELTAEDLDRSIDIMRNRVDKLGVSEPEIRKQGSDQIVIQLPAVHDVNEAASIIGQTAQLELYDLETSLVSPSVGAAQNPVATTSLYTLLTRVQAGQKGQPSQYYLFNSKTKKPVKNVPSTETLEQLKRNPTVRALKPLTSGAAPAKKRSTSGVAATPTATTTVTTAGKAKAKPKATPKPVKLTTTPGFPTGYQVLTVPDKRVVITCNADTSEVCPGLQSLPTEGVTYYYLFEHDIDNAEDPVPQMTGKDLKLKGTQQDFDPSTGEPIVTMQFTGHGNKVFHQITREEAFRGRGLGIEQHFAIVLDNEIRSFPTIDYKRYPDGIDPTAGGAQITGLASLGEAKNLALVLQTGALPVKFITVERSDVSATLGKDSLHEAQTAAIAGLLLVIVFLLIVYRFLGVVAVLGLGVYAAFMYGAILLFGVTLTLPGFAGLVLTIGVAADANIVIFERIKEEVRAGKSVRAAIAAGYQKGFHTIVDANAVTCITALVLFAVATASVKGFALMLLLGTVISLMTAVAATRAMLGLLAGFRWFDNPRFMGAAATEIPKWQRIDVVTRRRLWIGISVGLIALSFVVIGVKGLNLGIDFKGGVQITFTTPQSTSLADVRDETAKVGHGDAVVQGRGALTGDDEYKSFQIRLEKLDPNEQQELTNALRDDLTAGKLGVKNVSSSFSRQILEGAIVAIIVSFLLIAFYVTLRYRWRFAVPILRTLLSDIPITLGVYAISGREVSASTVAAILTILGYSVYDTIIVFDRIRENMKLMPRASIARIANVSVSEVLRRSIYTSTITLLPIVALFVFGGATLKDFAFAIIIGIAVGAVSTIFIATPLLTNLMERDPEYARRRDDVEGEPSKWTMRRAERAAAAVPAPDTPVDAIEDAVGAVVGDGDDGDGDGNGDTTLDAKRERRRQRRKARPHGRAR